MHRNSLSLKLQGIGWFGHVMLAGAVAVALSAAARAEVAKHAVDIMPSEAGETEDIDPKSVAVTSDGNHLTFVFDAGQDIATWLRANQATSLAEIWIDTDLDPTTGGKPFFADSGGFEYAAERVYMCKEFDGGYVCAGDVSDMEITGFFSSYEPQRWDPAIEDFADIYEPFWDGGRNDIDGATATVKIPYEEFEGTPGQTVSILIMAGSFNGGKFEEVQLELK